MIDTHDAQAVSDAESSIILSTQYRHCNLKAQNIIVIGIFTISFEVLVYFQLICRIKCKKKEKK